MSSKTYESKKLSELSWIKADHVVLKKDNSPVWVENGYSVLYRDSNSNKIKSISIDYEGWTYSEDSEKLDSGWAFSLTKGDIKLFGKVVTLSNRNAVMLFGDGNLTAGEFNLVITKSNSNLIEVNLIGEGLGKSELYLVEMNSIGSGLSDSGPVAVDGVVYNRRNTDYGTLFGDYSIITKDSTKYLCMRFVKDPSESTSVLQIAKDLTESGLSVTAPFTIVPRSFGDKLKVYLEGNPVSAVGGRYPNRYFSEGDTIKGIGIADIVDGGLSGEGGSAGSDSKNTYIVADDE